MAIRFPLGKDNFAAIRENGDYYVDKTRFVETLLGESFAVQLITRPRRFGKTLTMTMLEDFFDIRRDSRADFAGLAVSENRELCETWQNRWPTVFLTFKSVEGNDFETAFDRLKILISDLCLGYAELGQSPRISEVDRAAFQSLLNRTANRAVICDALYLFCRVLYAHYGKPVILLIDEYDVPLAKASDFGYYSEMLDIMRAMFDKALKSNEFLKFAVVTGCLRIAKESIFTGTNNFVVDTVSGERFDEYIGFTENDVGKILQDSGFADHAGEIREWYDGYRFGSVDVYCPWDVLNHVAALQVNPKKRPQSYWENTSHNNIIRKFIERTDLWREEHINEDFETLLAGGYIVKPVTENLTYDMLHSSADNLWSLLYLTGYLTLAAEAEMDETDRDAGFVPLRIPNEELRRLFQSTVAAWFHDKVRKEDRSGLFAALWGLDGEACSEILSELAFETISYHDYREDFYHAFVVGILSFAGYKVKSNPESGEGRPDILLLDERRGRAIVIELKRTKQFGRMGALCDEALAQIEDKRYAEGIGEEYGEVLGYGLCFFKKRCMAKGKRLRLHEGS